MGKARTHSRQRHQATTGYEAELWQMADTLRGGDGEYNDIPGFCKSATLEEVRKHGHILTPGRYVGTEAQPEDAEPFEEKMAQLTAQWQEQQAEARKLDAAIEENLKRLGFGKSTEGEQ